MAHLICAANSRAIAMVSISLALLVIPSSASADLHRSPSASRGHSANAACTHMRLNGHPACIKRGLACNSAWQRQYRRYWFKCTFYPAYNRYGFATRQGRWRLTSIPRPPKRPPNTAPACTRIRLNGHSACIKIGLACNPAWQRQYRHYWFKCKYYPVYNRYGVATKQGRWRLISIPRPPAPPPKTDPSLKHLVVVMLPGGGAGQSLVTASTAKVTRPRAKSASVDYKTAFDGIRKQGFLLKGFRQVSASGVANRIALLSGITPTAAMEAGCTGPLALASAADGCVVPPSSSADATDLINLVSPLSGTVDGGTRAYVETPEDDAYTDLCSPLEIGKPAPVWSDGTPPAQDNPLQWFQGITKTLPSAGSWDPSRSALCFVKGSHEGSTRPISMLGADLTKAASEDAAQIDPSLPSAFPMVTVIIPSRCRTDATLTCPDGKTHGGPEALRSFLDKTIGTTLAGSTIFKKDGAAFVMWDKAPKAARHGHKAAISTQPAVGALVLSPFTKAGGSNTTAYDTYGLLLTIETRLGLVGAIGQPKPLGGSDGANPMGREVFPAR